MATYQDYEKALRTHADGADFISISQFCRCYGCGQDSARNILKGLDSIKFGKDRKYLIREVARRLEQRQVA